MIEIINGKKKIVLISSAIVAAAAIGAVSINSQAAMSVSAYQVSKGKLESVIEVNGTVESDVDKIYYSDIDARIGNINVKEGDFVKKGDILITYDPEELERLYEDPDNAERLDWMMRGEESIEERNGW